MFQLADEEIDLIWYRKMRYLQNNTLVVRSQLSSQNKALQRFQKGIRTMIKSPLSFILLSTIITLSYGGSPMAAPQTRSVLLAKAVAACDTIKKDLADGYPAADGNLTGMLVCAKTAGWDISFDELAVISGASALFGYQRGNFHSKYANRSIGIDSRVASATGFTFEWVAADSPDKAWDVIKESIDAGKPLMGEYFEMITLSNA
jgi:hypothetical protein